MSRRKRDPRKELYVRGMRVMFSAMRHAFETSDRSQQEIADALELNKAAVSRRLNSPQNLTYGSLLDMLWAMGKDFPDEIVFPDASPAETGANYYPQKEEPLKVLVKDIPPGVVKASVVSHAAYRN